MLDVVNGQLGRGTYVDVVDITYTIGVCGKIVEGGGGKIVEGGGGNIAPANQIWDRDTKRWNLSGLDNAVAMFLEKGYDCDPCRDENCMKRYTAKKQVADFDEEIRGCWELVDENGLKNGNGIQAVEEAMKRVSAEKFLNSRAYREGAVRFIQHSWGRFYAPYSKLNKADVGDFGGRLLSIIDSDEIALFVALNQAIGNLARLKGEGFVESEFVTDVGARFWVDMMLAGSFSEIYFIYENLSAAEFLRRSASMVEVSFLSVGASINDCNSVEDGCGLPAIQCALETHHTNLVLYKDNLRGYVRAGGCYHDTTLEEKFKPTTAQKRSIGDGGGGDPVAKRVRTGDGPEGSDNETLMGDGCCDEIRDDLPFIDWSLP